MSETNTLPGSTPNGSFTEERPNPGVTQEGSILDELQKAKNEIALLKEQLTQRDEKIQQLTTENTSLKESVFIDSLTGCYNDKFLEHYIQENFDPNREDGQLSTIFFDVNGLKSVNDDLGHEAGDEVIKNAAVYLKSLFRDEDLIIHLHGDEFLVICKNQKKEEKDNFSTNFPAIIEQRITSKSPDGFIFNGQNIQYQVATGITIFDRSIDGDDLKQTIARADKLMYKNKEKMKNPDIDLPDQTSSLIQPTVED